MKNEVNAKSMVMLVGEMNAIALARKGLIPSYIFELWAKSHNGITPFQWKVLNRIMDFLWFTLAVLLAFGVPIFLDHYHLLNFNDKSGEIIFPVWMGFIIVIFLIGHSCLDIFKKLNRNWRYFNSCFSELARVCYFDSVFPLTHDEFIEKVHRSLVRRAYNQLKEKAKEDWMSNYSLRDLYRAAKEFGILKFGDSGYKPYFTQAQKELDEEQMPLFHQS